MKRTSLFPLPGMTQGILFSLLLLISMLAMATLIPIPLDPYLDFQVLYFADRGLLHGIPLYDQTAQAQMVANERGVAVDQVFAVPFPYPPWYALTTLALALLPIYSAARMWFLLNGAMLFTSVWLLTDGWHPRKRLFSFVAAFLFLPVLGALFVGQYVFPALLGMALIIYALKYQQVGLISLGMALATFKPHIGIFLLLAVLVHLLSRRDRFGYRAFWATAFAGVILFSIGFIADGAWPLTYFRSVTDFKNISECEICISLPLTLTRLIGLGFDQSAPVAAFLLTALVALFIGSRYRLGDEAFVAFFVCVPLLVNPYLLNYDFSFALIPLFYLSGTAKSKVDWFWIALTFFITWVGVGIFGRAGDFTLLVFIIPLTIIILTRLYKKYTILS